MIDGENDLAVDNGFTAEDADYFATRGGETTKPELEAKESGAEKVEEADVDASEGQQEGPEGADGKRKDDKVPLARFLETKNEAREAQKRFAELEKNYAVLNDRWNTMLQGSKEPEPKDQDPEPDPNQDLFAHQAWLSRQYAKQRQESEQRQAQERQVQERQQQDAAISQYWHQDTAEFSAKQPDFNDAANFLASLRDKELASPLSVRLNPQMQYPHVRREVIARELAGIISETSRVGLSTAEFVYEKAKERGYVMKQPGESDEAKKIEERAAAVAGSRSLSAVGGGRPSETTFESIDKMSDDDFRAWSAKPENRQKFRKYLGA